MIMINFSSARKRNGDGTFDGEVYLSFMDEKGNTTKSTGQRTVVRNCKTPTAAEQATHKWVLENIFPIIEQLPKAKP